MNNFNLTARPRRLRYNPIIRDLVRENHLTIDDLVAAVFVKNGTNEKIAITAMPGFFQYSVDRLEEEVSEIVSLGIKAVIVFGIPEIKDAHGSDSFNDDGIAQQAIRKIKSIAPDLLVISDICFCQYTTLGHCGVVHEHNGITCVENDSSLDLLAKQAISHAKAGADILAPSGMLDGMVRTIRKALDNEGYYKIPILSYAVKYRSSMYGPFGEAAGGSAKVGDRRTYQMDPANSNEALREAMLDIEEGADMLMVKPAHTYLDIIYKIKQAYPYIPLAAYHPSGEYMMLKAAIAAGAIDEERSVLEVLTSIKRAGANFIITYFAKDVAKWLKNS
ncbi:MAG: porphobilinogen synthase [Rickettsiales bacterium]